MLYVKTAVNRAQAVRRDQAALDRLRRHPQLLLVPMWGENSLLHSGADRACMLTGAMAVDLLAASVHWVFLGLNSDDVPVFAVRLDGEQAPLSQQGEWHHLRSVATNLPGSESALLGCARALLSWQQRTQFCGLCGAPTQGREGGYVMTCTNSTCATHHYPRTDPAVLMLVERQDQVLLHRQPGWAPGMWSILAGFVEPGESLEEAVQREVMEETGIQVGQLSYVASQPWPFPFSMMVGFTARAVGGCLRHDPHELEDARWFSRQEIIQTFHEENRQTGQGPYMPRLGSLSNHMLSHWLES